MRTSTKTSASRSAKKNAPVDDAQEADAVEVTLSKPLDVRIGLLKDFIATHPESKSKARATELLIVARAALGDEKLKAGETAAGVELLFQALADAPAEMSDRLFSGVVAQIPLNLYVRGETAAALKAAQQIEAKSPTIRNVCFRCRAFIVRLNAVMRQFALPNKSSSWHPISPRHVTLWAWPCIFHSGWTRQPWSTVTRWNLIQRRAARGVPWRISIAPRENLTRRWLYIANS